MSLKSECLLVWPVFQTEHTLIMQLFENVEENDVSVSSDCSENEVDHRWMDIVFWELVLCFLWTVVDLTVQETNRYVKQYVKWDVLKSKFRVVNWKPVTQEEIYVTLGLFMVISVIKK